MIRTHQLNTENKQLNDLIETQTERIINLKHNAELEEIETIRAEETVRERDRTLSHKCEIIRAYSNHVDAMKTAINTFITNRIADIEAFGKEHPKITIFEEQFKFTAARVQSIISSKVEIPIPMCWDEDSSQQDESEPDNGDSIVIESVSPSAVFFSSNASNGSTERYSSQSSRTTEPTIDPSREPGAGLARWWYWGGLPVFSSCA